MKKFLSLFVIISLLSGCYFSKESTVDYNNLVVQQIKLTTPVIEETATLYNSTVPDVVTEQDEIDIEEMSSKLEDARDSLEDIEALLVLESRNLDQQDLVNLGIGTYLSAAEQYFTSYEEMLIYYGDKGNQSAVSQVEPIDENLHNDFTTFTEANNDLVTTLETYVDEEEE